MQGFDVSFVLHDPDTAPLWAEVRTGLADMWILVHCGSSREPHGTMQHYHSRFSSPTQGEQNSYIWANSQYNNPEFDAIIDEMDSVLPSTDDPQYMDLANRALDFFLDDVDRDHAGRGAPRCDVQQHLLAWISRRTATRTSHLTACGLATCSRS